MAAQLIDQVQVYPATRICVPPSADSRGRLRIPAQIRSRRAASAAWPHAIEQRDPASADENAALIAEHLEAAGDLRAAFAWHMRAGAWSTTRDIAAAWV